MTNPRDDLMALAGRLDTAARILAKKPCEVYRLQQDCEIAAHAIRLAASRPATQVVDREAVARCMVRNDPNYSIYHMPGDSPREWHAVSGYRAKTTSLSDEAAEQIRVRADAILSLFRPAKAWDSATSPGMTDLMVSPESLDAVGEPGENVQSDVVAQRTWFDGENVRTENLTADDIYQKPDATSDAVGEPVAWLVNNRHGVSHLLSSEPDPEFWSDIKPLYTHPQKSPDISAAVLAERERCAAVCERIANEIEKPVAWRKALEFYADPFAWKKKHDPENDVQVPDFYSETSFGDMASEALAPIHLPSPTQARRK